MAQHVLSIGMSHSTLVILDDSLWGEWAAQDAALAIFYGERITSGLWTSRFATYQRLYRAA